MSKFLANENVPTEAVVLARQNGLDMTWMKELGPGSDDDVVLALSVSEDRVLVTFDKDFGDMVFQKGKQASAGIILFRPRLRDVGYVAQFMLTVLRQSVAWEGCFSVAREGQLRVVSLS